MSIAKIFLLPMSGILKHDTYILLKNNCLMPSELGIFSVLLSSLTPMGDKTISIKQKSDENKEKYHLGDYLIQ